MTAYKNKLKIINDDNIKSILNDLNEINMGFYVEEVLYNYI